VRQSAHSVVLAYWAVAAAVWKASAMLAVAAVAWKALTKPVMGGRKQVLRLGKRPGTKG